MISDKGNKLNKTVKFVVWLSEDNSGLVRLSAYPGSLPSQLTETRSFGRGKVQAAMSAMRTRLRDHEGVKEHEEASAGWGPSEGETQNR